MTKWFYQIKARQEGHDGFRSHWVWPPVFTGMVEATDKKAARQEIEDQYGQQFPMRVLKKDIDNHNYLLNFHEIKDDHEHTYSLFETKQCLQCGILSRRIDRYNDANESYKGSEFCSGECRERHHEERRSEYYTNGMGGREPAVIYRVMNTVSGMSYIGKTTQVFTLRWYQHFYHGGKSKFHSAIRSSKIEDWQFSILETVEIKPGDDRDEVVAIREQFWIDEYDAIKNGYNTATAKKPESPQLEMIDKEETAA